MENFTDNELALIKSIQMFLDENINNKLTNCLIRGFLLEFNNIIKKIRDSHSISKE